MLTSGIINESFVTNIIAEPNRIHLITVAHLETITPLLISVKNAKMK